MNDISNLQPDYYNGVREFEVLANIEDKKLDDFDNYLAKRLINLFISEADEEGIATAEYQYGIISNKSQSLDERRSNILMRLLPPQQITVNYFKKLLKTMNLDVTSKIDSINSIYRAFIDSDKFSISELNLLNTIISRYVPANLAKEIFKYRYSKSTFNSYIGVASTTSIYTHSDYREEHVNG